MQATTPSEDDNLGPDGQTEAWIHKRDIGVGGFGVVKLFINQTSGRMIVLKECRYMNLNRESMERWFGELKIIKRLNHPNIVHALDVPVGLKYQPMGNTPFICMEYCDGGDLRQVLRSAKNCCGLKEEKVRQICNDINAGIRFLHSQRVIHRDLKPENILIKHTDGGKVIYKLTDFGYSKSYEQNSVCTSLVGTMQYVAPEVIKNRNYHSSVDFWSFGVVVFECITGKRPFLHGSPSNNIAWIDKVAQKKPEVIHIYFKDDSSDTPVFSPHLPQPYRLSKIFKSHITSWLQTVLHFNPEMRGGRRNVSEDAPCLLNMDHILSTKVINSICMSTGEVYSFEVDESTTYDYLKKKVHSLSSVPPQNQFQILPSGIMPPGSDQVCQNMQENMGRIFSFATTLEPSFKMMHSSSEAVSTLIAYGDSKFSDYEICQVYSQVYFHIRENYAFFKRLHDGHCAMLHLLNQRCQEVQKQERVLANNHLITEELLKMVMEMNSVNIDTLESFSKQEKILPSLVSYQTSWKSSASELKNKEKELETLGDKLKTLQKDSISYLRIADDLQTNVDEYSSRLETYKQNFVKASCELYQDVKASKNITVGRSMQDILLRATQEAQSIIEESLNGYDFGQTFSTIIAHLENMEKTLSSLKTIKEEIMNTNRRCQMNLWDIIEMSSPLQSMQYYNKLQKTPSADDTDTGLIMHAVESSSRVHKQQSAEYLRQISSTSMTSSAGSSICDEKLYRSLDNFDRKVSRDENTLLIKKSKDLREQFQSLSRSVSSSMDARSHPTVLSGIPETSGLSVPNPLP